MTRDILQLPQLRGDRLVAHLLGNRDAVAFDLAIGVVGTSAYKDATLPADQYKLNLSAGIGATHFDAVVHRQPPCRDPIIDRRRDRARDPDRLELGDVLVAGDRIAAGPAGDDDLIDRQRQRGRRAGILDSEGKIKHGWPPRCWLRARRCGGPIRRMPQP